MTADAYREFADSDDWERHLGKIADVGRRAEIASVPRGRGGWRDPRHPDPRARPADRRRRRAAAPGEAHIRMLGVAPGARGRGVARALLDASFDSRARRGGRGSRCTPPSGCGRRRRCTTRLASSACRTVVFPDGSVFVLREGGPARVDAQPLAVRTTSPVERITPSSVTASTSPPRNCCSYSCAQSPPREQPLVGPTPS